MYIQQVSRKTEEHAYAFTKMKRCLRADVSLTLCSFPLTYTDGLTKAPKRALTLCSFPLTYIDGNEQKVRQNPMNAPSEKTCNVFSKMNNKKMNRRPA